ncbi:MAG: hypothetical protein CL816_06595 [Coxiellaceae bacterium]|nr:hypothetical protein [Coxiellaceae bacterium]|tara:strand:+ start:202 stop:2100 length:1899 start_codon:yes stop_codon:yes gene_type:complete
MLQKMNEYIKGWVAGVIVALVGATFVMWGLSSYIGHSKGDDAVVAKVNGFKITEKMVKGQYSDLKKGYMQQVGLSTFPGELSDELKQYVIQDMITHHLLLQQAKDDGFAISSQQVQALLMQDPAYQVDGKFSMQRLRMAMYQKGASDLGQFMAQFQQKLLISQVSAGMKLSSFLLPKAFDHAYGLTHQVRQVGYFALPLSEFRSQVKVSQKEVKAYYKAHQQQYIAPMQVSFEYLVLDPKAISQSIHIPDQEVVQYYEDHKSNYSTPKRWKVTLVKVPVEDAKESEKVSADKLQQFLVGAKQSPKVDQIAEEIGLKLTSSWLLASNPYISANKLEAMQLGVFSSPVQTAKGLVVFRVDKVSAAIVQPLKEVHDKIHGLLTSQQLEQLMSRDTEKLSQLSYTDPNSLTSSSKALSLQIQTTEMMTKAGLQSGLFSDKNILQAAFGDEVIKQGYNSRPVALKSGAVVVLRRHQVEESHPLGLEAVSDQIKEQLVRKKIEEVAGIKAYDLQSAMKAGQTGQALGIKNHLVWKQVPALSRDAKSLPSALVSAVFATPLKGHQPVFNSVLVDNKTYYVFAINHWTNPLPGSADQSFVKSLKQDLMQNQVQATYAAYVQSLRDRSSIKLYPSALSDLK